MQSANNFSQIRPRDIIKIRNALNELFSYYDIPHEIKKEKILYAREFLKYSVNDISSATLLYKQGIYPNALYSLQQSVEKLCKAYAAGFLYLDRKEVRSVKHYSPIAFFKLLEKFGSIFLSLGTAMSKAGLTTKGKEALDFNSKKYEKMLHKKAKDIANMTSEEISSLLKAGQMFTDSLNSFDFKDVQEMRDFFAEQIESEDAIIDKKEAMEYVDMTLNQLEGIDLSNYYIYLGELFLLGMITYPHENQTRYPDTFMKFEDYNGELGIINMFEQILDRVIFLRDEMENTFVHELKTLDALDQPEESLICP